MKLFNKNAKLWENNRITKQGLLVLAFFSVLGLGSFLTGRKILIGKSKDKRI